MSVYDKNKTLIFTGGTIATGGASAGDLAAEIAAREAGDAALANNIGKIMPRANAISIGQAGLPAEYGYILTQAGAGTAAKLQLRGANVTNAIDDLFTTSPTWGVIAEFDSAETTAQNIADAIAASEVEWQQAVDDEEAARIAGDHAVEELALTPESTWPGDKSEVLAQALNGPALAIDDKGRLVGTHLLIGYDWPGDYIIPTLEDERGVILEGYDRRDGSEYSATLTTSGYPGDYIIVTAYDKDGLAAFGFDIRDASVYPTIQGGGSAEALPPEAANTSGNAWNVISGPDGQIYYLSDQWGGKTIGFETRGTDTIAQTKSIATGVVAFGGGGLGVNRTVPETYTYHLFDEAFSAPAMDGCGASGAFSLDLLGADGKAQPTTQAIERLVASTTEADALAGSAPRNELDAKIADAVASLVPWGKTLFVDRILLSLLEGAPATGELTADNHYAAVANDMRLDIADATGQGAFPAIVVSQSAGTRTDGTSEVILAEGRLHLNHFSLGFIVATPKYPFPLEPGMPGTHTGDAYTLISELEALAVQAVNSGGEWYCPTLEEATLSGTTITARFNTMSQLVVQDALNHGFTISGETTTTVAITSVTATATDMIAIELDGVPDGTPVLNYAFGETGDKADGFASNRGSLRDSFSKTSTYIPTETLHRYALSGRVNIL